MPAVSPEQILHDTALLLRLLRPAGSVDSDWAPTSEWDWRSFARACDHHQVAPFIYCRLQDLADPAVPQGLMEHLRKRFLEVSCRNYHLAQKLVELTSLLEGTRSPSWLL